MAALRPTSKLPRRRFLGVGLIASGSWFLLSSLAFVRRLAWSQVKDGTPGLKDQLEKGLKARFPSEFAFIQTVVTMVENGQLPIEMAQSTFLWVRKNKYQKKYMMPYFERLLRARAAEKGIIIP